MSKIKQDRSGNEIGDGSYHSDYFVFDFSEYPQIKTSISKSNTTESVYVTYFNEDNSKSIVVRYANHENNAVKFGDQLNGDNVKKEEILFRIGLATRTFIPNKYLYIHTNQIAKKNIDKYEEADKTIQQLYQLGANADVSLYKGKRAKGSNYLILGDKVELLEEMGTNAFGEKVIRGSFIYNTKTPIKEENKLKKSKMEKPEIIARINAELAKIEANPAYENDDAENEIFAAIYLATGWDPQFNDSDQEYILKASHKERLLFALSKIQPPAVKTEADVIREIEQKIKESCVASRYNNLCIRVQTEGGLAYVVNRCIAMMAKDKIHLSAALATLESEEEGIN